MKKLAHVLLFLLPTLAICQKEKITFDTSGKKLYLTTEVEIDTAALYARRAKLQDKKAKFIAALAVANMELDTVNAQIKTARKLMTGKKGGGNNRAADTPNTPPATTPTTTKPKTTKKAKQ